ncbi:MAG TPA: DUF5666 domain-containing protein [Verrucomicrobiae bacterium]
MRKSITSIAIMSLLAAAIAVAPGQTFGQETKKEAKGTKAGVEKAEKAGKPQALPLGGKISAVDKTAKTITVRERTFQITSETRISKAGKPATFDDAVVGEEVGISYVKADDGKLTAQSVRIGPRPEGDKGTKGASKEAKKEGKKQQPQ